MNTTGDRSRRDSSRPPELESRADPARQYADIYTPDVLAALNQLAPFNNDQRTIMEARIRRRAARARNRQAIGFLDPEATIPHTQIKVKEARKGAFVGSEIPLALPRQWIQGTGPAAKPNSPLERSIRYVAYALLSGADGWMFDGEDALSQVSTMSLDNQRNLKLAFHRDAIFLQVAQQVAGEMNDWA